MRRLPLTEGTDHVAMSKVWYLRYSSLNRGQQGSDNALPRTSPISGSDYSSGDSTTRPDL